MMKHLPLLLGLAACDGPGEPEALEQRLRAQLPAGLDLPRSAADESLPLTVTVMVSEDAIFVEGERLLALTQEPDDGEPGRSRPALSGSDMHGLLVEALFSRLQDERQAMRSLEALTGGEPEHFDEAVLFALDRDLPYGVLVRLLYTAGQAGFEGFRFLVENPWTGELATVGSDLPRLGTPEECWAQRDEEPGLNLAAALTEQGILLRGADPVLHPDWWEEPSRREPEVACPRGCRGADDYDWASYNAQLKQIRDEYPDDETIIVVPDWSSSAAVMLRAADEARWHPHLAPEASEEAYWAWRKQRTPLFPCVVLAMGAR